MSEQQSAEQKKYTVSHVIGHLHSRIQYRKCFTYVIVNVCVWCSLLKDSIDDPRHTADDPGHNQENSRLSRSQKSEWLWVVRGLWVIVRWFLTGHIIN